MTLGSKLAWCFGASLTTTVGLGLVSLYCVSRVNTELSRTVKVVTQNNDLISKLKESVFSFRLGERGQLLFSGIKDTEKVASTHAAFEKARDSARATLREIGPLLTTDREKQLAGMVEAGIEKYANTEVAVWKLLQEQQVQEAVKMDSHELVSTGGDIIKALTEMQDIERQLSADAAAGADHTRKLA